MLRIPIQDIAAFATNRPESYRRALLAAGAVEDGNLLIEADDCARIHAENPPPILIAVSPEVSLPTLPELARNFLAATAAWAKAGFPVRTEAEAARILAICKGSADGLQPACPEWLGDALIPRCRKCGCTTLKPWLATEKCPLQKW
jgi:hypothetical protein